MPTTQKPKPVKAPRHFDPKAASKGAPAEPAVCGASSPPAVFPQTTPTVSATKEHASMRESKSPARGPLVGIATPAMDVLRLFERHGPWWTMSALIVLRLPYILGTAAAVLISIAKLQGGGT